MEYYYRLGRIQQNQNRLDQAISNYQRAIVGGKNSSEYQLCAVIFISGEVYEKKMIQNLLFILSKCIDTNPKDYGNGLHQKQSPGLSRIDPEKTDKGASSALQLLLLAKFQIESKKKSG